MLAWQQIVYCRQNFTGHECDVEIVFYNAAFKHLFSIDLANIVNVWDVRSGASVLRFTEEHVESVTCACLYTRGRKLITGSLDGLIKVWNVNTGWLLGVYKTDGTRVPVLALSSYSGTDSPNTPSQPQSTNNNNNSTGNNSSSASNTATLYSATPHEGRVSSQKRLKYAERIAQQQQSVSEHPLSAVYHLTHGASHAAEHLVVADGEDLLLDAFKDSAGTFYNDKQIHSAAGSMHC